MKRLILKLIARYFSEYKFASPWHIYKDKGYGVRYSADKQLICVKQDKDGTWRWKTWHTWQSPLPYMKGRQAIFGMDGLTLENAMLQADIWLLKQGWILG